MFPPRETMSAATPWSTTPNPAEWQEQPLSADSADAAAGLQAPAPPMFSGICKLELKCANPNCYYLVHSSEEAGPFCCGRCWGRFTGVMKGRVRHGSFCEKRVADPNIPIAIYIPTKEDLEIIESAGRTWQEGASNYCATSAASVATNYERGQPPSGAASTAVSTAATELPPGAASAWNPPRPIPIPRDHGDAPASSWEQLAPMPAAISPEPAGGTSQGSCKAAAAASTWPSTPAATSSIAETAAASSAAGQEGWFTSPPPRPAPVKNPPRKVPPPGPPGQQLEQPPHLQADPFRPKVPQHMAPSEAKQTGGGQRAKQMAEPVIEPAVSKSSQFAAPLASNQRGPNNQREQSAGVDAGVTDAPSTIPPPPPPAWHLFSATAPPPPPPRKKSAKPRRDTNAAPPRPPGVPPDISWPPPPPPVDYPVGKAWPPLSWAAYMAGRVQHGSNAEAKAQALPSKGTAAQPDYDGHAGQAAKSRLHGRPGRPIPQTPVDVAKSAQPHGNVGDSLPWDAKDSLHDSRLEYAGTGSGDRTDMAAGASTPKQSSDGLAKGTPWDKVMQLAVKARIGAETKDELRSRAAAFGPEVSTSAGISEMIRPSKILQRPQSLAGPPPALSSTTCSPGSGSRRESSMGAAGEIQQTARPKPPPKDDRGPQDMQRRFDASKKLLGVIQSTLSRAEEESERIRNARQERTMSSAERWLNGEW